MTRFHGRLRRCLAGQSGGATIEYGLLLAIVAGGLFVVVEGAGAALSGAQARVAAGLAGEAPPRAARSAIDRGCPDPVCASLAETAGEGAAPWQVPTLLAVLLSGCPTWYMLRQRRRRGTDESSPAAAAAPPSADSAGQSGVMSKRQETLRVLASQMAAVLHGEVKVAMLMTPNPALIGLGDSKEQLRACMARRRVRHLLVGDPEGRLQGVVSDRDLLRGRGETAADLMTRAPITVAPDTPLGAAATLLLHRGISCLPVVAEGRCVGVLTTTDLVLGLQCVLQVLQRAAAHLKSASGDLTSEI